MKKVKKWLVGGLVGVLVVLGWWLYPREVRVVRVVDGDTVELADGRRVRYIGVDTPEEGECFREESVRLNEGLVEGKKVRVEMDVNEMDRFGRYLAYVWVEDELVNEELLRMGAGEYMVDTVNLRYQERLVRAAEEGKEGEEGLWAVCGGEEGCLIKGNLDRLDKRWYHLPEFRHYDQVVMNLDEGDRWFCSEEEAVEVGFERARE